MINFLLVVISLSWLISTLWYLTTLLQFFQLHEYDNARFLAWSWKKWSEVMRPSQFLLIPLLWLLNLFKIDGLVLVAILWGSFSLFAFWQDRQKQAKIIKPLVYTQRIKRLCGSGLVVLAVEIYGVWAILSLYPPLNQGNIQTQFLLYVVSLTLIEQLTFVNIVLANMLVFPLEELLRAYYVFSARRKIRDINPLVIGITGSYGKTSTKEILAHLLSTKYEVLKTPKSYNTLMGICKVIREDLRPQHTHFIVELGAYQPGEIAKLCRLVKPKIGLLTAVGPQHLERFKTIENVAQAKNELMESLPQDGVAIFNGDDPICLRLSKTATVKTKRYGLTNLETDLQGCHIEMAANGMNFEIASPETVPQEVKTKLLGRHNVSNILGASLAALELGLSLKEIAQALAVLAPIEHRLQLIAGAHGVTYLDDAYNSNPVGAAMALEVLGAFQGGRKFLVTPGIVELGEREDVENEQLGHHAATICDIVVLTGNGKRVNGILKGLTKAHFNSANIFTFNSLAEARLMLRQMVRPGDVVLFENDISDIY